MVITKKITRTIILSIFLFLLSFSYSLAYYQTPLTNVFSWYGNGDDTGYIYCDNTVLSTQDYIDCDTYLNNFIYTNSKIFALTQTGDNDTITGPGVPYTVVSSGYFPEGLRINITGSGGYPVTQANGADYILSVFPPDQIVNPTSTPTTTVSVDFSSIQSSISSSSDKIVVSLAVVSFALMFSGLLISLLMFKRS